MASNAASFCVPFGGTRPAKVPCVPRAARFLRSDPRGDSLSFSPVFGDDFALGSLEALDADGADALTAFRGEGVAFRDDDAAFIGDGDADAFCFIGDGDADAFCFIRDGDDAAFIGDGDADAFCFIGDGDAWAFIADGDADTFSFFGDGDDAAVIGDGFFFGDGDAAFFGDGFFFGDGEAASAMPRPAVGQRTVDTMPDAFAFIGDGFFIGDGDAFAFIGDGFFFGDGDAAFFGDGFFFGDGEAASAMPRPAVGQRTVDTMPDAPFATGRAKGLNSYEKLPCDESFLLIFAGGL